MSEKESATARGGNPEEGEARLDSDTIDVCISYPTQNRRQKVFVTQSEELIRTLCQWKEERKADIRLTWGRTPDAIIDRIERALRDAGVTYAVPSGKRVALAKMEVHPKSVCGGSRAWVHWVHAPRRRTGQLALGYLLSFLASCLALAWVVLFIKSEVPGRGVPGPIMYGLLLGAGILVYSLFRYAKRHRVPNAVSVLKRDRRAPVLLLRAFGDDYQNLPGYSDQSFLTLTQANSKTFEEWIYEQFSRCGPVIAVGRPGETTPPLGASRLWVRNDDDQQWKRVVAELLQEAQYVVMIMGRLPSSGTPSGFSPVPQAASTREGIAWEAKQVLTLHRPENAILIMPPVVESEARYRWNQYAELSQGRLGAYQGGEIAATFAPDGGCRIVRTSERGWFRKAHRWDLAAYAASIETHDR